MKLAAVSPMIDFNIDSLFTKEVIRDWICQQCCKQFFNCRLPNTGWVVGTRKSAGFSFLWDGHSDYRHVTGNEWSPHLLALKPDAPSSLVSRPGTGNQFQHRASSIDRRSLADPWDMLQSFNLQCRFHSPTSSLLNDSSRGVLEPISSYTSSCSTILQQIMPSALWETDLQNLYSVDCYQHGRATSLASQQFAGN